MTSTRRLAAIMFTDIVGYTALMGGDEKKAFDLLEKNRLLQRPIIEEHHGKWIKELGDGVMASFDTVSDAVNAAIKIQQRCNSAKEFQLRIGIHLGEVVFDNGDVFGDGVNIASRIQAIAHPGCIFISETIHNSIANKKEFQTKYFTEQKLKNVSQPVKIYQVIADNVCVAHQGIRQKIRPGNRILFILAPVLLILVAAYFFRNSFTREKIGKVANTEAPANKSIAVLPFDNMSGDSSQEYFSDGMTESLISDLAQIPGLFVIARNSVFQYKGKAVNPIEVGKQLNVRYILEGSLQRSGEILRVNAQLIDTRSGFHVWADRFDKKIRDLFSVQDEISRHIIDSLQIVFVKGQEPISKRPTTNLDAYECYLRGSYLMRKALAHDRHLIDSAITCFEKAVSHDPQFALAYAAMGKAYSSIYFIYDPDSKWESKAYVAIEKALSLDNQLAEVYLAKSNLTWTLSNGFPHEKAIRELKQAISLDPNLVEAHEGLASVYFHIGLLDEALKEFRISLTLDPASNFAKPRVARIHWYQQKLDSALLEFSALKPSGWLREHAMVLWTLGRREEAFAALDKLQEMSEQRGEKADAAAAYAVLLAGTGRKKEAEEKIRFAIEHGEGVSHFHHAEHLIACAYALMGDAKAAVEWLQKASDHGLPCYPLFRDDPNLKNIRNDPGYISFMNKLKKVWEENKKLYAASQ